MKHLVSIDLLRGIAAFFIVGCHLQLLDYTPGAKLLLSCCDMNVGVFAAISGFMMKRNEVDCLWSEYVLRRGCRLFPAYIFWTVLYLCASAIYQCYFGMGLKSRFREGGFWVEVIFLGAGATHLWYLICLFYAQCIVFPVRKYLKGGIGLLASFGFAWAISFYQTWFTLYPCRLFSFMVLGWVIGGVCSRIMCSRGRVYMICGILVLAAIVRCRIWFSLPVYVNDWICVGAVMLFFVGLENNLDRGKEAKTLNWFVKWLGCTSMGVFCVHPLVTVIGARLIKSFLGVGPYDIGITLMLWWGAWMGALMITIILLRIRGIRRFVQ